MNTKMMWCSDNGKNVCCCCWLLLTLPLAWPVTSRIILNYFKMIDPFFFSVLIWSIIIIYEHNNNETFWRRKNIGHCCGPLLMASLPWVVVIDHIIFPVGGVIFCYLWIEFKYEWFDSGYIPTDFQIWRRLLGS